MSATREGGLKAADKNKATDKDFYKKIGAKGGKAKVPKGMSMATPEQRREWARKGGQISRRS